MDIKMNAQKITASAHPVWDVKVEKTIVPMVTGDEEDLQNATLAGFLEKGTIPLLPDAGVSWSDYLTGSLTFGELDAQIRDSISEAGKDNFYPDYEIENDQLIMTIGKVEE